MSNKSRECEGLLSLKISGIILLFIEILITTFIFNIVYYVKSIPVYFSLFIYFNLIMLEIYGLSGIITEKVSEIRQYARCKLTGTLLSLLVAFVFLQYHFTSNGTGCNNIKNMNEYATCINRYKVRLFMTCGFLIIVFIFKFLSYLVTWIYSRKLQNKSNIEEPVDNNVKITYPTFVYVSLPDKASNNEQ